MTTSKLTHYRSTHSKRAQLMLCYISGLDLRRVLPGVTPFLAEQFDRSTWRSFVNLPSNELFPTLVTGVDPTVHGVWGIRLAAGGPQSWSVFDHIPDLLTTSVQCARHWLTGDYDLAAMPPRRRRRFDITRTKYKRRSGRSEALFHIGSISTVLDIVGCERADYRFNSDSDPARSLPPPLCRDDMDLEVLELYGLDRHQQWNLHDARSVEVAYARTDGFLEKLFCKCVEAGKTLLIVSDHGHQTITRSIDLDDYIGPLELAEDAYTRFTEVSSVRFWFHSNRARQEIPDALRRIDGAELASFEEMRRYGVPLTDGSYGELFCFLPPGSIFFPHDFYQPLANLFFGLTDPEQRSRLRDPRHRGNHGHLPHHEAERSFALVAGPGFRSRDDAPANILDVAPSILSLLELPTPEFMTGRALFERA